MKLLATKHEGMKISADGILGRIRDGRHHKQLNYACGIMLKHLEEMATRFYAGEPSAVDEFLQLYCLDDARPECTCSAKDMPFGLCCKVTASKAGDGGAV